MAGLQIYEIIVCLTTAMIGLPQLRKLIAAALPLSEGEVYFL